MVALKNTTKQVRVELLGVRHHGPGSARAVAAALAQLRPDVVLIEGPPEADALLPLAASKEMTPPVALLAHVVDEPARAAFWPFAAFSPEWVALCHALDAEVPVRFIDLPAAHAFALAAAAPELPPPSPTSETPATSDGGDQDQEQEPQTAERIDPIAELARAAGQEDAERWWDDVVEHMGHGAPEARGSGDGSDVGPDVSAVPASMAGPVSGPAAARAPDALAPFRALAEAMTALREQAPETAEDARREAWMRKQIRAASRAGFERIAVVCGAWHVPALAARVPVAADNALLRGLPKAAVEITWVPWTHRRLSQHTGYGAGIASPGWYQHLFESGGRHVVEGWLTRMAALLREEDHPVSSAHVIEAVRLAGTLAALRGRPLPGLAETVDAAQAVLCDGSEVPLRLIEDRLIIGDALGQVPEEAPAVPLQRDLTRFQRALRLKPEARIRALDLDLRKNLDAERSRLLHRLALLGIDWAVPTASRTRSTGTFRESWELAWEPELAVRVAEAGVWGTTVEAAASARTAARAVEARRLGEITELAERCLLAQLPEALPVVLRCLADRAALDTDVAHLAEALPALVRSLRYGDVRSTGTALLAELADSLAIRICVGLPAAASSLDPAAADTLAGHVSATHAAVSLLAAPGAGEAAEAAETLDPAEEAGTTRAVEPAGTAGSVETTAEAELLGGATDELASSGEPASGDPASGQPALDRSASEGPEAGEPAWVGLAWDGFAAGRPASEGLAADGPVMGRLVAGEPASEGAAAGQPAPGDRASGQPTLDRSVSVGPASGGPALAGPASGAEAAGGIQGRWEACLRGLVARESAAPVVRGRAARLLLDDGRLADDEAARLLGLALTPGVPPAEGAAWVDGFLAGSGVLLVHDRRLLQLVDAWITAIPEAAFPAVLPLLRRTFSRLEAGVRRGVGEQVRAGNSLAPGDAGAVPDEAPRGFAPGLDAAQAAAALATVRLILGGEAGAEAGPGASAGRDDTVSRAAAVSGSDDQVRDARDTKEVRGIKEAQQAMEAEPAQQAEHAQDIQEATR